MTKFSIDWPMGSVVNSDIRDRTILRRNLNDEWTIVCVLQKDIVDIWKYTSIELHRKNTGKEFSISGELIFQYKEQVYWKKTFSHLLKTGYSLKEIISDLDTKFFLDNSLIFGHINISHIDEEQTISLESEESKERIQLKSLEELSNDFEKLLQSESSYTTDVTLKCNSVTIPAHKIILSTRSPVFARMFATPMKGSPTNEVDITDVDESTLREMLKYMYTGKTSDLTAVSALDLLSAANKYKLQGLKTACLYYLKEALSVQNVWHFLKLGDIHFADLKSIAVDYICQNFNEFSVIENTQEWKTLREERPDLAVNVLESMVKYREEKLKRQ